MQSLYYNTIPVWFHFAKLSSYQRMKSVPSVGLVIYIFFLNQLTRCEKGSHNKLVELVGWGSVINGGYPVWFWQSLGYWLPRKSHWQFLRVLPMECTVKYLLFQYSVAKNDMLHDIELWRKKICIRDFSTVRSIFGIQKKKQKIISIQLGREWVNFPHIPRLCWI